MLLRNALASWKLSQGTSRAKIRPVGKGSPSLALIRPIFPVGIVMNGCLVIGHNTAGTKEILSQDQSIGLPYDTSEELLNDLLTVSNNMESYFPMIKKAQVIAISKYSTEQNVDKTWGFYCKILNNNRHDNILV